MVECKNVRKGIIRLQWELKMMEMQIEDLNNKARDIRKLKLSEEQQDVSAVILKHPYFGLFSFFPFTQTHIG